MCNLFSILSLFIFTFGSFKAQQDAIKHDPSTRYVWKNAEFNEALCIHSEASLGDFPSDPTKEILKRVNYDELLTLRLCDKELSNHITFYKRRFTANLEKRIGCLWYPCTLKDPYTKQATALLKSKKLNISDLYAESVTYYGKKIFLNAWFSQDPAVIKIAGDFITQEGDIDFIVNQLSHNNNLKHLALRGDRMSEVDQVALDSILKKSPHLESLEVGDFAGIERHYNYGDTKSKTVSDSAIKALAKELPYHKNIKFLEFSGGCITDTGATILAEKLQENHSLKQIVLNTNKISAYGFNVLEQAGKQHPRLESISVMHNYPITGSNKFSKVIVFEKNE